MLGGGGNHCQKADQCCDVMTLWRGEEREGAKKTWQLGGRELSPEQTAVRICDSNFKCGLGYRESVDNFYLDPVGAKMLKIQLFAQTLPTASSLTRLQIN